MKTKIINHLSTAAIIVVLSCLVLWFVINRPQKQPTTIAHTNGELFAGSQTCKNCHQEIYNSHVHSAHYLTSQPARLENIKGSFKKGQNRFYYGDSLYVEMQEVEGHFYQVSYVSGQPQMTQPFDIVIGSGRKGQTYLFWNQDHLFQLPVSYYTPVSKWSNSPGYPKDMVLFNRLVEARCLECHSTFFKETNISGHLNSYDREKIIYGVDCERCHGPAARHVEFHNNNPNEHEGKFITNASRLSRQQRLEACALCHAGLGKTLKPSFSFTTGDKLSDYLLPDYPEDSLAFLDVHGNQFGLLQASKCFRKSENLDCSSCHNPHKNERVNLKLFSQRCMNCHNGKTNSFCSTKTPSKERLRDNCIDCHMPLRPSRVIAMNVDDQKTIVHDSIRTHLIGIYSSSANASKIVDFINKNTRIR